MILSAILTGCAGGNMSLPRGNNAASLSSTTTFANSCKKPRESIILHPDGTGIAKLTNGPQKNISWQQNGKRITLNADGFQAVALLNKQQNLVLESTNKKDVQYVPMHERTRYRCS